MYWCEEKQISETEWRIQKKTYPQMDIQFMTKRALKRQWREMFCLNKWYLMNGLSIQKKIILTLYVTFSSKINFGQIVNLNVKGKRIELLEDNMKEQLHNFEVKKDFLGNTCICQKGKD